MKITYTSLSSDAIKCGQIAAARFGLRTSIWHEVKSSYMTPLHLLGVYEPTLYQQMEIGRAIMREEARRLDVFELDRQLTSGP